MSLSTQEAARPTELLARLPRSGMRERIRWVNVRKLMRWDKGSLTGKGKTMHSSETPRDYISTTHWWAAVQPSTGKQSSIMQDSDWGRQMPSLRMSPPSFSFPWLYTLSTTPHVLGYFCQISLSVGASCPGCVPSMCAPSLLTGGMRDRKGLDSG